MIRQLLKKFGYRHISTIEYGWRNCVYCGVDIQITSWATSVETHERGCAFLEVKRLKDENEFLHKTIMLIKAVDTETCLMVARKARLAQEMIGGKSTHD